MSNNNHINFQITHKNKSDKTLKENNNSILLIRRAINSICSIFSDNHLLTNTTFAIRYLKDEDNISSPVKTYFSVSRLQNDFSSEEIESIQSNVETTLGNVYKIFQCQLDWQQSLCTNAVSQIIKDEFFDLSNNLYAPKFLKSSNAADFHQVINFMESKDSKTALEVCLQPYHSPTEKVRWMQAIEQMIQTIQSDSSSKSNFAHALADYQAYQKHYSRDTTLPSLFNYSVKAYGEKQSHVQALLNAFRDSAISQDNVVNCLVKTLTPQTDSLVKVSHTGAIERPEWQNISLVPIKKTVQAPKKGWEALGNGSLNIDNLFSTGIGLHQITSSSNPQMQALTQGANQSSQGQLVLNQGGQITQNQAQIPITIADLKPLHQIVCLEEIQGFLNLVVSLKTSYPTMTAEQIFDKYRHLITLDTYIVGLDDEGQPITSSWDDVPHRLLAGVPGAGKTNFLRWLLFQFLYANPKRKVYITDFKGLDFQFLEDLRTYADISITIESCQAQVAIIQNEEFLMRQQIMAKHKVTKLSALRKELQKHNEEEVDRTLWLIDEAADISFASNKVRTEIENSLTKYARQGRSYGIQVVYCTQRVSSAVITPQVTDQCEEKVIFRVGAAASTIVLQDSIASEIPMDAKGRAVLDSPQGRIFINTPFMQSPEGSDIPISATLWKHLQR